jgi:hypothetical protein
MRILIAITRAIMIAIGITLPTPEQEKRVAIIWLLAAVFLVLIVLATGWAVLNSMSRSVTYH